MLGISGPHQLAIVGLELACWEIPTVLGAVVHEWARPKTVLPLIIANESTDIALRVWNLADRTPGLFGGYGILLAVLCITLRRLQMPRIVRALTFTFAAAPGAWYFFEASYLAGKVAVPFVGS